MGLNRFTVGAKAPLYPPPPPLQPLRVCENSFRQEDLDPGLEREPQREREMVRERKRHHMSETETSLSAAAAATGSSFS